MHPHRSMAIFILNKTSRLEPKSQKRVESALYDAEEWFFPGEEHIDGTIEGAMKAGLEAYPA